GDGAALFFADRAVGGGPRCPGGRRRGRCPVLAAPLPQRPGRAHRLLGPARRHDTHPVQPVSGLSGRGFGLSVVHLPSSGIPPGQQGRTDGASPQGDDAGGGPTPYGVGRAEPVRRGVATAAPTRSTRSGGQGRARLVLPPRTGPERGQGLDTAL